MTNSLNKRLQITAFILGAVFLVFSVGFGEARYYGLDVSFFRSFAVSNAVTNPQSLELVPVGSANLDELKKGDVFQAITDKGNFTLAVKYNYTPPGEPTQYLESSDWAAQDQYGVSLHQITEYSPTGRYQITEFKDNQAVEWVYLGQAGPTVTVGYFPEAAAEGINLEIKPLGKADLTKLKPGDQYSVTATKVPEGSALSNTILDVKYVGPDTNKQEQVVEQWARLDKSAVAVMNITSATKPGDYILTTVRVHTERIERNAFAAPANYVPRLTVVDTSQLPPPEVFEPIEFSALADDEKVVASILGKTIAKDPGTRYVGDGWILTDKPADYYGQWLDLANNSSNNREVDGFTIRAMVLPDVINYLNSKNTSPSGWPVLQFLVSNKILSFKSSVWGIGPEGGYGFFFANYTSIVHENQHLLNGLNQQAREAVTARWNALNPEDQVAFFLALLGVGYTATFDSFTIITEWSAFTAEQDKFFLSFYKEIKSNPTLGTALAISHYASIDSFLTDSIEAFLGVVYDQKLFKVVLFEPSGQVAEKAYLSAEDFAEFVRDMMLWVKANPKATANQVYDKIAEKLRKLLGTTNLTGTYILKNGNRKVVYVVNGVPQNSPPPGWESIIFSSYSGYLGNPPTRDPGVVVTARVTSGDVLISFSAGFMLLENQQKETLASQLIPQMMQNNGIAPSAGSLTIQSADYYKNSRGKIVGLNAVDDQGNKYSISFNDLTLEPTGFALLVKPDGTAEMGVSGKNYQGTFGGDDGSTARVNLSNGGYTLGWKDGSSGRMECSAQRDCQLYDGSGKATWHIDSNGYVTNPGDGWNGRNPFDASRAQIVFWSLSGGICSNGCGPVSGYVQDSSGWHSGGYIWPDGSWSPSKGTTGPPKKPK